MKILILSFFLLGCAKPHVFVLQSGLTVTCRNWGYEICGLWLDQCDSGLTYECQQNVMHATEKSLLKDSPCHPTQTSKPNAL